MIFCIHVKAKRNGHNLWSKSAKIRILHFLAYLALLSYLKFCGLFEMKISCAYIVKKILADFLPKIMAIPLDEIR